jgi:putative peptide zinc metalloprotease protein
MTRFDYCAYPPLLAPDLEISEQNESESRRFIAGSAAIGRYLLLGQVERQVIELINGERTPCAIVRELLQRNGSAPAEAALTRFLQKLDEVGILAGQRSERPTQALLPGNQLYFRCSLFNPDRLFGRLLPALRWIWTSWFFIFSALLIGGAGILAIVDWPEFSRYAGQNLQHHYLLIFCVAWLVTITHEFAHGLTSKAFGGRATEIGGLLIYYCLPALFCNVSGLHLIAKRGQRLWVIAAGIYWQLLVGAFSLIAWYLLNPHTWMGRIAMAFVLGSLLDLVFNANPLIKLDGYYFLSQWLRIPNLMDRSRTYWRGLLWGSEPGGFSRRDRRILLPFGLLSFAYNLALPVAIVWYASQYLMDRFQFAGLLLSGLVAAAYLVRPLKKILPGRGGHMEIRKFRSLRTRHFVFAAIVLVILAVLGLPWRASVGSYGMLVAIPGREAIVRAPENASLLASNVQPGQQVARGQTLGRMGNLDLEEQIAQVRTDLARLSADEKRLTGEIGVQQDAAESSAWQLAQRRREFRDLDSEEQQIRNGAPPAAAAEVLKASYVEVPGQSLPPALAALEAEAQQLAARAAEAGRQAQRDRTLHSEGLMARSELDAAEGKSAALAFDLDAARQRLRAALVEHQRRHSSVGMDVGVARAILAAAQAQEVNLRLQLNATRSVRSSLMERLALLERKRAEFDLLVPQAGTVFGEDLPRMQGQYFMKGAEICRVTATGELLVRVQVPEQAMGDIASGNLVRVKTRAFPDRVFRGAVSKIGGESELDADGQRTYRVELTIQNPQGLLRPGMTVFARVDFGRRMVGWLLAHKLKQALRPEMWML